MIKKYVLISIHLNGYVIYDNLIHVLIANLLINPVFDIKIIRCIIKTRGRAKRINRLNKIDRKFTISAIGLNISSLVFKLLFVFGNYIVLF